MIQADNNVSNKVILADECREYLRQIYSNAPELLRKLFPVLNSYPENVKFPMDCFFMDVVIVTPPKARPTNVLRDEILEHPQTILYKNIIESNSVLRLVLLNLKNTAENLKPESKVRNKFYINIRYSHIAAKVSVPVS